MTLEEGKTKVGILLDEYENGQIDPDAEARMPCLFDMAQKLIAGIQPIVKTAEIVPTLGTVVYPMPGDFARAICVWKDGRRVDRQWIGRSIVTTDAVTVEYAAVPETITEDTDDTHTFEVSEIACQAMPFFVAANCIMVDPVTSPNGLMNQWQLCLNELKNGDSGTGRQRRVKAVW